MNNFSFKRVAKALIWVFFGFAILLLFCPVTCRNEALNIKIYRIVTRTRMHEIAAEINLFYFGNDYYPHALDELNLSKDNFCDCRGDPLAYKSSTYSFTLRAAGPDGQFNTEDDMVYPEPENAE